MLVHLVPLETGFFLCTIIRVFPRNEVIVYSLPTTYLLGLSIYHYKKFHTSILLWLFYGKLAFLELECNFIKYSCLLVFFLNNFPTFEACGFYRASHMSRNICINDGFTQMLHDMWDTLYYNVWRKGLFIPGLKQNMPYRRIFVR